MSEKQSRLEAIFDGLFARSAFRISAVALIAVVGFMTQKALTKLDDLTIAQVRVELGQARMEGNIQSISSTIALTNQSRDKELAQMEGRLLFLERARH